MGIITFFAVVFGLTAFILFLFYLMDLGGEHHGIVTLLCICCILSTIGWSMLECQEKHSYRFYATDKQEKIVEIIASITEKDELQVAGVVLLCDENLTISEMLMAIDGTLSEEGAKELEKIIKQKLDVN